MKKYLPLIEKILLLQVLLSGLLLIGFGILSVWFVLATMMLASFYMVGTYFLIEEVYRKKISSGFETILILHSQIQLAISLVGLLFKVMGFPGAAIFLLISGIGLLFVSIVMILKQYETSHILMKRTLAFGLISALLYWVPISTWLKFRYHLYPEYAGKYEQYLRNPSDSLAKANWLIERERTFSDK